MWVSVGRSRIVGIALNEDFGPVLLFRIFRQPSLGPVSGSFVQLRRLYLIFSLNITV